jgi:hypothetical protein
MDPKIDVTERVKKFQFLGASKPGEVVDYSR